MDIRFQVHTKIQKPVSEVFEAVYDPKKLSGYFTTAGASAPLDAGTTVMWDFADFPGAFPVVVKECVKNQKIVLQWDANDTEGSGDGAQGSHYKTTVTMEFKETGPSNTLVSISESGWRPSEGGMKAAFGNCQGWSQMLSACKAFVEYGINLRKGAY